MMRKCLIYRDNRGKWRWRVVAGNNRITNASTQGYSRKSLAVANFVNIVNSEIVDSEKEATCRHKSNA